MVYRAGISVPGLDFIALDVETACSAQHSICQIGLVKFRDGLERGAQSYLVNPETDFDDFNVALHGISSKTVRGHAALKDVLPRLFDALEGNVLVSHSGFDRRAFASAAGRFGVRMPDFEWIDTVDVARDAWPDLNNHKLDTIAEHLAFAFRHHDAGEDALASGHILAHGANHFGDWEPWVDRPDLSRWWYGWEDQPRRNSSPAWLAKKPVKAKDGNSGGALFGNFAVFTGEISMDRTLAVDLAVKAGCSVRNTVSRKTTLLIVGAGGENTTKMRAAKAAIAKGQKIEILYEDAFLYLVGKR